MARILGLRDWSALADYGVRSSGPIIRVIHMVQVIKLNFKYMMKKSDAALIKDQIDAVEISD